MYLNYWAMKQHSILRNLGVLLDLAHELPERGLMTRTTGKINP